MADLLRIISAVESSEPPAHDGEISCCSATDDPVSKENLARNELFKFARQRLPRVLGTVDADSPSPELHCRLTSSDKRIVQKFWQDSIALPNILSCCNLIKEHFIKIVFDSGKDPVTVRSAILATEGFFAGLVDGVVREWLRHQNQWYHRERQESRRFILREKKRYATVFYRMSEPAFVVDEKLRFIDVNPAFTSFFGLKPRAVLGSTCGSIIGGKFCDDCPLEEMIQTGGSFSNFEIEITVPVQGGKDSETRTVRLGGSSLGVIEDGGRGGIVILEDITSYKRFEAALRESEEKYRSLIENLPDVTWRADRAGRLIFASPNLEKICHTAMHRLLGRDRFERVHEDDIEQVREAYELLFASGARYDIKYRFRGDDDAWIWLHDRADKVIEVEGEQVADGLLWDVSELQSIEEELDDYRCWLEDFVDERTEELLEANERLKVEISERKQIEMELVRMTASLKRSNAELEQFAHVASHDLKEPLMLVTAFAEKLLHRYSLALDERGNEYLKRIVKAARQSRELVDALLEMSRVTTSTRVFESLDMDELVRDVVADLEEMIRDADARISIEIHHRLDGDPVQIRQLFQNMIVNAIKYRREDVPLSVCIKSRTVEKGVCEITVDDNGIGFDPGDQNRIFDPFVRLHGKGKYEGSGVGLTTCKKIVHRHGGDIFAKTNDKGGALFVIRLPMPRQD
ncbi:MAG: PAS domain S-box protein [Proteobacteria bacterium]|nr:PAS domain S-box protein [Pseudomonadota bacterium]MBU1738613.1 PAS domain S-box protein [Pseudomonadota bacterium]